MNQEKMQWHTPTLEVLDVNETMAGIGYKQIDWVSDQDADLYNPS
ncbi:paeninodin family lasso peptide [Paenibacillus kyungheensis]